MSRLQRLERLKGSVIKDVITEKIPKDMDPIGEGFTAVDGIRLQDGRTLMLHARGTEDIPVVEVSILPKQKGG